jgi:hypothetical protein
VTTQTTTAACFSAGGGRSFSVSATDGTFANRLVSDVGSAQIGFAMTNELVDRIQVTYAAGSCAWRLMDSVSQTTLRVGFGFNDGAFGAGPYSGNIAPITITQNMVLEVYPMAVPT